MNAGEPLAAPSGPHRSSLIRLLRLISRVIPGDYLKTYFYLNVIEKPRRALRLALNAFYRIDHVYQILREFAAYSGSFSILEFGTSDGYAFTKILYATKYLKLDGRVTVHGFDTFEGMPPPQDASDLNLISTDTWAIGEFRGRYDELVAHCRSRYRNFRVHKGFFSDSLTPELISELKSEPPILVWFDCDYYSSARVVFERLAPILPNGCVLYFDEFEQLNFGSRFTGEARLVHEVNTGVFGDDIELALDSQLSLSSRRLYRFVRMTPGFRFVPRQYEHSASVLHLRSNDSAMP